MTGAGVEPVHGMFRRHAAAILHAARPGAERRFRGLAVARSKRDDVTARQAILAIQAREFVRRERAAMIDLQLAFLSLAQGAADDLHHLAFMEIDTGSELHFRI